MTSAMQAPRSALYETIHRQPAILRDVLGRLDAQAGEAAAMIAPAGRVWLVGTGTSSHAAVVGEHLLRLAGIDAYATTPFDFVTYPRPLRRDDALVAISHRGSKRYGMQAIARARDAGIPVLGVTGLDSPMADPALVLATAPQETSSAHSASYTANLVALGLVAVHAGERRGVEMSALRAGLDQLPESVAALLAREAEVRPVAEALAARGRMILIGAGPNAVTAREGALKVKETSYLVAEGFELETVLHGALPAVEPGDVAVVIAADGPALERTREAIRALDLIGARLLVIADERVVDRLPPLEGATIVPFAPVVEPLSPALAVIPLQLLTAYTATLRGTDADGFRADDPAHRQAHASYTL